MAGGVDNEYAYEEGNGFNGGEPAAALVPALFDDAAKGDNDFAFKVTLLLLTSTTHTPFLSPFYLVFWVFWVFFSSSDVMTFRRISFFLALQKK